MMNIIKPLADLIVEFSDFYRVLLTNFLCAKTKTFSTFSASHFSAIDRHFDWYLHMFLPPCFQSKVTYITKTVDSR